MSHQSKLSVHTKIVLPLVACNLQKKLINPFSIVISSVDAGTAKVVTQVIAEMAAASGVTVPPPGSPAAVST